jgi:hypothetical protein
MSGTLLEADLDKAMEDMWNQPTNPPPLWIKSSEIKAFKRRWWSPVWWFKYHRTRRSTIKIVVDITKSLPKADPYPGLSRTTYKDLK